MSALSKTLAEFYRTSLGCTGTIPLHEPWLAGREWEYTKDCLDTGWVSSVGSYVVRFEEEIAKKCELQHAVATVNGTAALHISLVAMGVGANDLVICPALSFVATANAISYCNAEPVFLDVDPTTLGLSVEALEAFFANECRSRDGQIVHRASDRRIAACIVVHVFGHPVEMDPILAACGQAGIPILEDAAEALGSRYKGRPCGSMGLAGTLSFNGNKILTTGGGGMVVTNDNELANTLKHMTTTAKIPHAWQYEHDAIGYNYRLPNINAALGCAQLERLDKMLALKRRLSELYQELFIGINGVEIFRQRDWSESNFWLNAILLKDQAARDALLQETSALGIQTRPCWSMLADLSIYRTAPRSGQLLVARNIESRLVNLPSSPQLLAEKFGHAVTTI